MEEGDIDSWYDESKEKAMEKYLEDISEKKDQVETEKTYKKKLFDLRIEYSGMYDKMVKRKKLMLAINKKISYYKNKVLDKIPTKFLQKKKH